MIYSFLQKLLFPKYISEISSVSNSLDPDQAQQLSLIWVQTVCNDYYQKILAGKKLDIKGFMIYIFKPIKNDLIN